MARTHKSDGPREMTVQERRVVFELRQVARHWPATIMLVSMDGGLQVVDKGAFHAGNDQRNLGAAERQALCVLADIDGIPNDGGGW